MSIKTTVYQGQFIHVIEENINGVIWEKAHLKSAVIVYPFTARGEIIFVKEYRPHETPHIRIKPVTGILEPHLSPIENANKEMQEEIGIKANSLENILTTTVTGSLNSTQHFIAAWDLEPSKLPNPDGEDSIQEILYFSFPELMQKVHNMEIPWSLMTLGLFRLQYLMDNKKLLF